MLKVDDASSKLSELVGRLAPGFFDPLELAVAPDGAFADLAFDLIVTGEEQGDGGTIARSGKSPVIFGRSADFAKAADKVIAHKRVRGGPLQPAPDYLLVPGEQAEAHAAWLWSAAIGAGRDEGAVLTDPRR